MYEFHDCTSPHSENFNGIDMQEPGKMEEQETSAGLLGEPVNQENASGERLLQLADRRVDAIR